MLVFSMYPELGAFFKFTSYKKHDFSRHFEAFPAYLLARITWRVTMVTHFKFRFRGSCTLEDQKSFQYSLNHKSSMLVVSLNGEITSQVMPAFETCRQQIQDVPELRTLIIFFQNVSAICPEGVQILAQIQREARARPAEIRLVSLSESLRGRLVKMGVVRSLELSEDLRSALMSFVRAA